MQLRHSPSQTSAVFDDPNLVSCAGLAPVVALASSIAQALTAAKSAGWVARTAPG